MAVAPISVLVDPVRAERIFGLAQGGTFSDKVLYIYLKQVEEVAKLKLPDLNTKDVKQAMEMVKGTSTTARPYIWNSPAPRTRPTARTPMPPTTARP